MTSTIPLPHISLTCCKKLWGTLVLFYRSFSFVITASPLRIVHTTVFFFFFARTKYDAFMLYLFFHSYYPTLCKKTLFFVLIIFSPFISYRYVVIFSLNFPPIFFFVSSSGPIAVSDSITAVQLGAMLRQKLRVEVPPSVLLPTGSQVLFGKHLPVLR